MSQPIYCSASECGTQADVIIGDTHTGDQTPLCYPHLYEWCGIFTHSVDDAEIEDTDAAAIARIADVHAPAEFPATAKVVRKHTSRSRQAYEARRADKLARAEQSAAETVDAAFGPPEADTDDAEPDA